MVGTYALLLSGLGLVVTVQAQDCEVPLGGSNMNLIGKHITFPHESKVSFACSSGYVSAGGSPTITCTAGSWSPLRLKCERKSCGSVGEVEHGDVHYPNGSQFGDSAVVTCKTGFILVGKSKIRCGSEGWMDKLPSCEVVVCQPPSKVVNGTFSPHKDNYRFGEVVKYTCQKDYTLNGSDSASCSEDETFKPHSPTCVYVQCKDPIIPDAEWIGGSLRNHGYLATVIYQCNPGYAMIGDRTLICGINSQWSPGIPRCQPQDCPKPSGGPNMSLKENDNLLKTFSHGTQVTFACDFGYVSAGGSAVITCSLGRWSPVQLKCEKVKCEDPIIDYAERTGGSQSPYKYKDTVTYKCQFGYTMEGKPNLECGIDGQWSPGLPSCQPQDCPKPAGGSYMSLKENFNLLRTFSHGTQVTFACDVGYVSAGGSAVITCSLGRWSPVQLNCESSDGPPHYVKPLGIALGVALGILSAIGLYYYGVPAIKKRLGSRRSYPDSEAKDGEGVALSSWTGFYSMTKNV